MSARQAPTYEWGPEDDDLQHDNNDNDDNKNCDRHNQAQTHTYSVQQHGRHGHMATGVSVSVAHAGQHRHGSECVARAFDGRTCGVQDGVGASQEGGVWWDDEGATYEGESEGGVGVEAGCVQAWPAVLRTLSQSGRVSLVKRLDVPAYEASQ